MCNEFFVNYYVNYMEVKFYLRNSRSNNKTMILLSYSYNANGESYRLRCSTKERIEPKNWNPKGQKVKSSAASSTVINAQLRKINSLLPDVLFSIKREGGNPSEKHLQERLYKELDGTKHSKQTFFEYADNYHQRSIDEKKSNQRCRHIKSVIKDLRTFQKWSGKRIDFDTIDLNFYDRYKNYHLNHRGNNLTTFGSKVAILKAILNDATARKVNSNMAYKTKGFTAVSSKSDNIYLTRDEIKKIATLKLKEGLMDVVRDLFLIGTETGFRFKDYSSLSEENFDKKNQLVRRRASKTKERLVLPISPILKVVLEKHDYKLPKSPPNQVTNRYLKKIGKMAGVTEDVQLMKNIAGVDTLKTSKKYENIVTHTARRSFATNLYLKGIPAAFIMKFTGHKDEKTFFNYVKVDLDVMAGQLAEVINAKDY